MAVERPKLILNRNYVLTTMKGHSVRFEKGVPTFVPPAIYADAIAIGATPEDGSDPDILPDTDPKRPPNDPQERDPKILAAIKVLVERNERGDFTAAGAPKTDAVSKEVDFKVDAKEVHAQWQAYRDEQAENE